MTDLPLNLVDNLRLEEKSLYAIAGCYWQSLAVILKPLFVPQVPRSRLAHRMQRVGLVDSTGELLYNFALSIYDVLPVALQDQLREPDEERFTSHNPYTTLDRFLKQLDPIRAEQRFIITIDELNSSSN